MPNLGFWEIIAIMAVVLLVFGAKRLPEIGASMGKGDPRVQALDHRDPGRGHARRLRDPLDAGRRQDPDRRPGAVERGAEAAVAVGVRSES